LDALLLLLKCLVLSCRAVCGNGGVLLLLVLLELVEFLCSVVNGLALTQHFLSPRKLLRL
jgi:hypothetical protein